MCVGLFFCVCVYHYLNLLLPHTNDHHQVLLVNLQLRAALRDVARSRLLARLGMVHHQARDVGRGIFRVHPVQVQVLVPVVKVVNLPCNHHHAVAMRVVQHTFRQVCRLQ